MSVQRKQASGKYLASKIEAKWQRHWDKHPQTAQPNTKLPKKYVLIEFPYPSGDGLHVGHVRPYSAMDAIARQSRLAGHNVLFPIGWDAFGLPTENYAIKTGQHPRKVTNANIANFRRQMKMLGLSFDWSREVDTTDPAYYRWTQWIFLQLFEKGLAYQSTMPINWCPSCKIGLANEEVVNGKCERCGTEVTRRMQKQWMLKITAYADRLLKDLDSVDYIPKIKTQQVNWIGKSEGAEIKFQVTSDKLQKEGTSDKLQAKSQATKQPINQSTIAVFTTRPDTIFGATYLVVAPEHELVKKLSGEAGPGYAGQVTNSEEVEKYIKQAAKKSDLERTDLAKTKTGVELKGIKAINPANNEEIPIWVADYVLSTYGTGAIMAVPAHDERDYEFAKRFKLPIRRVVEPKFLAKPDGDSAIIPGQEFIKRNAVCAIVRNPKDNSYLCISWKTARMHGLVTGGLEAGEDPIEAARREVREETGYKNLKLINLSPVAIHNLFYHRIKKQNRWARFQFVFYELENDQRDPVVEKEADLHEVLWLKPDQLKDFFTVVEGVFILNLINQPDYIYIGPGVLYQSGQYDWMDSEEASRAIIATLKKQGVGKTAVQYKLRDWVFSRQHYWGEPIPIIHCDKCGVVPVPVKDLPIELPHVEKYLPTDTGESPLANMTKWVNTKCPQCGGPAKRETDTMPNWAGSSWYYLRYCDPHNTKKFAEFDKMKYWLPVDIYNGGMEHTVLHLLYSRFWHKFLFDQKLVPFAEPYKHRHSHGMVLAEDGRKMSKSWGNVINPDDVVKKYGADTLRMYEMFMGPFEDAIPWSTQGVVGVYRFLNNVWELFGRDYQTAEAGKQSDALRRITHRTIRKITDDLAAYKFNTAVSALMEFSNFLRNLKDSEVNNSSWIEATQAFLILLFPFAPHIASELWEQSNGGDIQKQSWPKYDSKYLKDENFELIVQINGKVRGKISNVAMGIDQASAVTAVTADDKLKGKVVGYKKVVYVPNRLINFIV